MLGDETWLKLFPGLFTRHDGVSSFFVSIYFYEMKNEKAHIWDLYHSHTTFGKLKKGLSNWKIIEVPIM